MVNTIFILNEKKVAKKMLTIDGKYTFYDDLYTMDLSTGVESFEFTTNVTDVDENCYVMFYYHNQYKLFQIIEIEQQHSEGKIESNIYAESSCLELLNSVIRPFKGEFNAISFLEYVLDGTSWKIGECSTSLKNKVASVDVDKTTQIWGVIQSYMTTFGYEINTRVAYSNGKVTNYLLDIYEEGQLGERTYKRFEYSRNVTDIIKKKDLYDFCTAIVLDSTISGVTDIEIDLADYKKTKGSDTILAKENNNKYNDGKDYIYGVYSGNDKDANILVENGLAELQRRSVPKFDYECTTVLSYEEYQDINIGDTVYVIDHTFEPIITLEARIGTLEISFTDRENCKCNLTNYKEIKGQDINSTSGVKHEIDKYFPVGSNGIQDGAITEGKIDTTYLKEITSDIVSANLVVTEELIAKEVTAINGQFENLDVKYATIDNLNVTNANIGTLNSDVANIKTLVNGNLTSENIQSLILSSDKVTVVDAFIKDAMIDTINANKITSGTIDTSLITIKSNDGAMQINGTVMQFKDKNGNVRIQIGKDAQENFTFVLYGEDGQGQLINEKGITASAIQDGLIVDSMIGADANISGTKLNINSVIKTINESDGSEVLSSTKIYLDDEEQTLQLAFGQLKNKVDTIEQVTINGDLSSIVEQVTSNTTNIDIQQGQINSLIANTTITKENGQVVQLKDDYNLTKNTVDSHSQTISSMETNYNALDGEVDSLTSKTSSLEQDLNGFKTTVTGSYYNKTQTDTMINGVNTKVDTLEEKVNSVESTMTEEGIKNIVKETTYTKTEIDDKTTEITNSISSEVEQSVNAFTLSFRERGGYNLLYNGSFKYNLNNWSITDGFTYSFGQGTYSSPDRCGVKIVGRSGTSCYLTQKIIDKTLLTSPTYTLSGNVYISSSGDNDTSGANFEYYIRFEYWDGGYVYHRANIDTTKYDTWQKVNITASRDISRTLIGITVTLAISHTTKNFYLSQAMLEVGTMVSNWTPNPNEINDGVVTIDNSGIKVAHSNYDGYTHMRADGFYVNDGTKDVLSCNTEGLVVKGTITSSNIIGSSLTTGNISISDGAIQIKNGSNKIVISSNQGISNYTNNALYSNIDDGVLSFYEANRKVGSIGKHVLKGANDTGIYGMSMNTEEDSVATFGTYYTDDLGIKHIDTFLIMNGTDGTQIYDYIYNNAPPNIYTLNKGINMFSPTVFNMLKFGSEEWRPYIYRTDFYDSIENLNFGGFEIVGYGIHLTPAKDGLGGLGLRVEYDNSSKYNTKVNCYGNLDMQGFTISNVIMTSSLEAQSLSTYSLYNEGSIEMNTYVPYTFTEDEIRYVEREPQHTMEDENGQYVCYCEIPIFMAENIELNYHINISKLSFGDYRIIEKTPYYFIVESENDGFSFTYEVVAKQIEKANTNNSVIANNSVSIIEE